MKNRLVFLCLLLAFALPSNAFATQLPSAATQVFDGPEWEGYTVAALAGYGGNENFTAQYAFIMKKGDHNVLCIVEREPGAANFQITIQTDRAVYQGDLLPSLLIDSGGDALFYTYRYDSGNLTCEMYGSIKQDGIWGAPTLFLYYGMDEDGLYPEAQVFSDHGFLFYNTVWCDENENIVRAGERQSISGVPLTTSLADFDIAGFTHYYETALAYVNVPVPFHGEAGTTAYPFSGVIPDTLAPVFSGDEWAGYRSVSGSYATRFYENNCAQIILEKDGRYVLCVLAWHDGAWQMLIQTENALFQDRPSAIVADVDYGENFDIVYNNAVSGVRETYSFFRVSDTWRLLRYTRAVHGTEEIAIDADQRALRVDSTSAYNPHSILLEDFDIMAFPRTREQVIAEGKTVAEAQSSTGFIRQTEAEQGIPFAPVYEEPSAGATLRMKLFRCVAVEVLGEVQGFAHIRVGNVEGYVPREDIAIGEEKASTLPWNGYPGLTRAQLPEIAVPLYADIDVQSQVMEMIPTRSYVRVLGITPDTQWLLVVLLEDSSSPFVNLNTEPSPDAQTVGYMSVAHVTQTDNFRSATIYNPNPSDRLHLRAAPDKNAESLGKYYCGVEVEFLFGSENADPWRHVIIEGAVGYVNASFLDFSADQGMDDCLPPLATVQGTNGGLHLRKEAGADAASLGLFENGTEVEVLAVCGGFAHVRMTDGLCGYMMLKHLGGEPERSRVNSQ